MKYSVFTKSVVGYKNFIKNQYSQDYIKYQVLEDGVLCAVADGHSGKYYTFADRGAKIACDTFISVFSEYIDEDKKFNDILYMINKKIIQKDICDRWKKLVYDDFIKFMPRVYKMDFFRYGTTLLGIYINDEYRFFFRIGDGEILVKKYDSFIKIFEKNKGRYVDTLSEEDAFKKAQCKLEKVNKYNNQFPVILYSDGFENSFTSYNIMIENLSDIILKYNSNIFIRNYIEKSYENKLIELSKNGSRDDITIAFVNLL